MVDESTRKTLSSIPLLKTKAGPRDTDLWGQRLKEEYMSLIKVSLIFTLTIWYKIDNLNSFFFIINIKLIIFSVIFYFVFCKCSLLYSNYMIIFYTILVC